MDARDRLLDAVNELTLPHKHNEPRTYRDGETWITEPHVTDVPSLLDQLAGAIPGRTTDSSARGYASRTPGRDDAIDVLMLIDTAAWVWCDHAGLTCRPTTAENVRALVGLHLEQGQVEDLSYEARSWVSLARVTTGWDKPAMAPDNTCPLCGKRGGLRIKVGDGVRSTDATAACLNCHEYWDNDSIGLLAEHIRSENNEDIEVAS